MILLLIPDHVRKDVEEYHELNHCEGSAEQWMEQAEPFEVFDRWLTWNGIRGFSRLIWDTAESLRRDT